MWDRGRVGTANFGSKLVYYDVFFAYVRNDEEFTSSSLSFLLSH